jgi:hypothetical protein
LAGKIARIAGCGMGVDDGSIGKRDGLRGDDTGFPQKRARLSINYYVNDRRKRA